MAEYIEREATIESYCQKCKGYYDGHCIHRGECDVDVIQTAPAADVQPMKRGHWITNPYMLNRQKCSECGFWSDDLQADNYCPACGAKMDGDTNG